MSHMLPLDNNIRTKSMFTASGIQHFNIPFSRDPCPCETILKTRFGLEGYTEHNKRKMEYVFTPIHSKYTVIIYDVI